MNSQNKFTPGPWEVWFAPIYEPDDARFSLFAVQAKAAITLNRENEANAQLIAAAPELLEALQNIVNGIQSKVITSDHDETFDNVLSKAVAALKKARGEA